MEITDDHLRAHRTRPAVLKVELSRIRSHERCRLVFVVEGRDDLKAFDVWLRRVDGALKWEALVARGKANALEFREMLKRDLTGLGVCTYFLLDGDYDAPLEALDVYELPAHSVENILTSPEVVESLLITEFALVGDPGLKQRIVGAYEKVRREFAEVMRPACETMHASRKESCGRVTVSEKCLSVVDIDLELVVVLNAQNAKDLIVTEQVLGVEAVTQASAFFSGVDAGNWVRGKYMFSFFKDWCQKLMHDRRSDSPRLFPPPGEQKYSLSGEWSGIASLAARSKLPAGLADFLAFARDDCAEKCQ